jgi:lipopolysaccharide biosynthesis protein
VSVVAFNVLESLFDGPWYLAMYPDVEAVGMDPLEHYVNYGWKERRQPHRLFDPHWYLSQLDHIPDGDLFADYIANGWSKGLSPHPLFDGDGYLRRYRDVASSGVNPLIHYLLYGRVQRFSPHELFDASWYLTINQDVELAGLDAFEHYLDYGWREGRDPHPVFDVRFYLQENPDVESEGIEPLTHYILAGWKEGRSPGLLFDVQFYLREYPDVAASGEEPLLHYLMSGARDGHHPHPLFDTTWYMSRNYDVTVSGLNPLIHFLSSGGEEGRSPHPLFNPQYYRKLLPADVYVQNPLLHYIQFGAKSGLNPNYMFDGNWYMAQHELLRHSGVNPLIHYVIEGRWEGRDPHPNFDLEWYLAVNQDVADNGLDPLAHFLTSGAAEGRNAAPPNCRSSACAVLDIPYELRYADADFRNQDVCVLVTYARHGKISRHTIHHIRAYAASGFKIVLVIVTEGISEPVPEKIPLVDALIVRLNHGWDFAAWATALSVLPDLWHTSLLILANDSVYGPISLSHFDGLISSVRSSRSDVIALTDSYQNSHHYMSYFTAIKPSALQSAAVRRFWNDVRSLADKDLVIHTYEIPALRKFTEEGLAVEILFPTPTGSLVNPTLVNWRDLLRASFPFIKVQALRDDLEQVDKSGWELEISDNPALLADINSHLEMAKSMADKPFAPIPSPKRRFKRPRKMRNAIGAVNAVRPSESTDLVIKIPFDFEITSAIQKPSIAVIAHIYYPELSDEMRQYIENIPYPTNIYISTDTVEKKREIEAAFAKYRNGRTTVKVFPNIGRDIAPMIVGYRDVITEYEFILHIHSKRSPHNDIYSGWRTYLLDNLVGTSDSVEAILTLFQTTSVGVAFADHFPQIKNLLNWGYNFNDSSNLLGRMGVVLEQGLVLEFPSSSFFWARTAALRPLMELNLTWEDFSEEGGQIDGTIAHAIERSLLYIAEAAGYSWTKVGTVDYVSSDRLVGVFGQKDVERALVRTFRPMLGNPIRPYRYYDQIPEERSVAARVDTSTRARLNLVIPTLRPELVFGGINTAIKTFQEIASQFDTPLDLRILVLSTSINIDSTRNFPEYRVVPSGSPYDDFPKTIVDVCDKWSLSELSLRKNDIFVTTAWWTHAYAESLKKFQRQQFGTAPKTIYMIQDFESGFYPWSNQYSLAGETYKGLEDTIALVNSEELSSFMLARYNFHEAYVIRYKPNEKIENALIDVPRERILLFYGRPGTPRNCFQAICQGIFLWQQKNPVLAADWRVVSVGEKYPKRLAEPVNNLEILGKMSLEDYGGLLSRASVGISLMVSPHPSYPPLEMALAGMAVITNGYDTKNLNDRSPNILSIEDISAESIERAISKAVLNGEKQIGKSVPRTVISEIPCDFPDYSAEVLVRSLTYSRDIWQV